MDKGITAWWDCHSPHTLRLRLIRRSGRCLYLRRLDDMIPHLTLIVSRSRLPLGVPINGLSQ